MKESQLIRLCLVGSVIGLVALYFASALIEPLELAPGEVDSLHIGREVRLSGTVQEVRHHRNGHVFFELSDRTGDIDVVIWEDRAEQLRLYGANLSRIRDGARMNLTGSVEKYRGSLQVVV